MKNFKVLLAAAFTLLFFAPSYGQLKVASDGKVGIGTTTPDKTLEVLGTTLISNNNGVNQNKQSNFMMRTYANAGTHFSYFNAQASNTNNLVLFGGGNGAHYAATAVAFMTDTTVTDLLGVERLRVNNLGLIRMNPQGASGALTHTLNVIVGDASKPGGGSWATPSDARIKKDVRPFTDGLQQVLKIAPVFFSYKENTGYDPNKEYVGVIAQEMRKVAPYTVEEVKVYQESDEARLDLPSSMLTYNSTAVTYMLVNAVKEQQAIIDEQNQKIEDLETRLARIEQTLASTTSTNVTLEGLNGASLKQNAPNPFTENTTIEYTLPRGVQNAFLQITNTQGALMRKVNLQAMEGVGVVNIKAKELAAGEYMYTLVIDGKVFDTKKMVLMNN